MEGIIIWKMAPVFMGVLWVLGTFKYKLIQRGHVNAWIAVTMAATHSNLAYYGMVIHANFISMGLIIWLMWRSLHPVESSKFDRYVVNMLDKFCKGSTHV